MEAIVALLLLLANGLFVGAEFAAVAARPAKLEALQKQGSLLAGLALRASRELSLTLSAAQLGITMASLGLGYLAEPAIGDVLERLLSAVQIPEALLHTVSAAIALLFVLFLHMVIGEIVPKNIAIAQPERSAIWFAAPMRVFTTMLRPVIWFLTWISNHIQTAMGVEPVDELSMARSAEEISALVAQSREGGLLAPSTHLILEGALSFSDETADKVMIPWHRVVRVDPAARVDFVEQLVLTSGHSRLIASSNGDVLGFIHAKDLLKAHPEEWSLPVDPSIIRELLVVSSTATLEEVMVSMRRVRTHIALVVDSSNSPVGIVTLEDILEQVVGDIRDESDESSRRVHRRH